MVQTESYVDLKRRRYTAASFIQAVSVVTVRVELALRRQLITVRYFEFVKEFCSLRNLLYRAAEVRVWQDDLTADLGLYVSQSGLFATGHRLPVARCRSIVCKTRKWPKRTELLFNYI